MHRLVEFIGIPGAGKTTLLPTVVARLSAAELSPVDLDSAVIAAARRSMRDGVYGPMLRFAPDRVARHLIARSHERFLSLGDALVRNPDLGIAVIDSVRQRRAVAPDTDRALTWMLETIWKYELWRRGNGTGLLVVDEGFSHRSVTLLGYRYGEDKDDFASLQRYVDAIPAPSLVIKVETDPSICFERAGVPDRFERFDEEAQHRYLDSARACIEDCATLLVSRGVDMRAINNNGSVEDAQTELAREIDSWVDTL